MPESSLRCDVIVINFNGAAFIRDCLESVRRQRTDGLDVSVLVVDNASTDGSAELIAGEFPEFTLLRSARNGGFGAGVNQALAVGTGEVAVLLNPDAVADPDFLIEITAPLLAPGAVRLAAVSGRIVLSGRFEPAPGDPGAYVSAAGDRWARVSTGGVQLLNSTGSQVSRSGNARDRSWLAPIDAPPADPEVFGFCGGAAAIRRSALADVGTFDESLFMYYEDVDLSWRLRRAGWQIAYAAAASTTHQHAASSGIRSRFFLVHNFRNRILVAGRNGPPSMVRAALVRTVGNLGKSVLRSLRRGQGADARRQALATVTALARLVPAWPRMRNAGRQQDRAARLPRDFVQQWTLPD